MAPGSTLRSAIVGFGLAVAACLAATLLPSRTRLPPATCALAVLLTPVVIEGLLRRVQVSLGSFSPWGLLLGAGLGIAFLLGAALLDWPMAAVGVGSTVASTIAFCRPSTRNASRGRALHYGAIGALSGLLTIVAVTRWMNAMPLTSLPWYGPMIAAVVLLLLTCAGGATSSLLRHRLPKRAIEVVLPFVIGAGIVVIAALLRPVPRASVSEVATQVQLPSISFGSYALGIALLAIRLLFVPATVAGFCLGFTYGIQRRRGRSFLLAVTPCLASLLILGTPVLSLVTRLARSAGERPEWVGLCSPESAVFHPAEIVTADLVSFAAALVEPARGSLLIVGDGAMALSERVATSGKPLCVAAESASELTATTIAPSETGGDVGRVGSFLLLPSVLADADPRFPPGWPFYSSLRSLGATGAAIVQILNLGTTSLECLRSVVETLQASFGSPALWISGIHVLLVWAPSDVQAKLDALESNPFGPWRLLNATEIARIGKARSNLPLALLAPMWQRRLQPYDPFLASRHLRWLLSLSSWPLEVSAHRHHFRGRIVESLLAARLTLDRQREIELIQQGLATLPDDAAIASFQSSADRHYDELRRRVLKGLERLPGDTTLNFELARLQAGEGAYPEAQKLLTGTVIQLRRNFVEAYATLADVLERMDRTRGLPGVVEKNGFPYCGAALDVVETAVRGYAGAGEAAKARRWLDELRRSDPDRPGLAWLEAQVAIAEENFERARDWLERARAEEPCSHRVTAAFKRLDQMLPAPRD